MQQLAMPGTYADVGTWRPGPLLSDEAYTPGHVLGFVEALAPIDTDPCWSPLSAVSPQAYGWTVGHNGLEREWWGHVFCNPPFSEPYEWSKRCKDHAGELGIGPASLLLTNECTTAWARMLAQFGSAWRPIGCFFIDIETRVEFDRPFAGKGPGNRGCNRLYLLGHTLQRVIVANALYPIGRIQRLGGI